MDLETLLTVAVYLLAVTAVCVSLLKRIGLGAVLGLLIAGIIVGPYTPGPVATTEVESLRDFTHIGVVLLLFLIGLEMEPSRLWRMRQEVFGLGLSQVLVTGGVLALYSHFFVATSSSWAVALVLGLTFALSSTAFTLQTLDERGELTTRHGQTALAVLLMQDIVVIPLLAVVPLLALFDGIGAAPDGQIPSIVEISIGLAIIVSVLLCGRYAIPWVLDFVVRQRNMEALLLVALLSVLGAAWATAYAGLSMELGAFVMGMTLSRTAQHRLLIAQIQPFKGMLMSLFFISVGMSIDVQLLFDGFGPILRDVAVIMAIKASLLLTLCFVFRVPRIVAVRASFFLAQCGEFGFVLFALAFELGILGGHAFLSGLVVIAVSMLVSPFFAKIGEAIAGYWSKRSHLALDLPELSATQDLHVVVAGYGRAGRTICTMIEACGVPYVAFDIDHERVSEGKRASHTVFAGDIRDNNILTAAGVGRSALVVVTVNDAEAVLTGVSHMRQLFPDVPVIVRTHDLGTADRVKRMGVAHAIPEAVEASLQLSRATLHQIGIAGPTIDEILAALRANDYRLLHDQPDALRRRIAAVLSNDK